MADGMGLASHSAGEDPSGQASHSAGEYPSGLASQSECAADGSRQAGLHPSGLEAQLGSTAGKPGLASQSDSAGGSGSGSEQASRSDWTAESAVALLGLLDGHGNEMNKSETGQQA